MDRLIKNERAVSPVIGTTLMVGMTVAMVAAVAIAVLGFALPEDSTYAKIVIVEAKGGINKNLKKNTIMLRHKGGDSLSENHTKIIITGKGCAYTGSMSSCLLKNIRANYIDLTGENFVVGYNGEIVKGTSWDAGETIVLYGSDGRDLDYSNRRNNVDSKWKLQAGSEVVVIAIDVPTGQTVAVTSAKVIEVGGDDD